MAYAFRDSKGWLASFKPPRVTGQSKRRVRCGPQATEADALALAQRLDALCRQLDHAATPSLVAAAIEARAISHRDADLFGAGEPEPREPTIADLYDAHPSTQRERESAPGDYRRHVAYLNRYCAAFGNHVSGLTLSNVVRWLQAARQIGQSWDTRRHHLLPLRRAARMASTLGYPDQLSGFRLDQRDAGGPAHEPLELSTICRQLEHLAEAGKMIVALGAFCGLRPSEIRRARWADLAGDVLTVGNEAAKNASSRRAIPLPQCALDAIQASRIDDNQTGYLIGYTGNHAYSHHGFTHLCARIVPWPVRDLRKAFARACIRAGVEQWRYEAYMGHITGAVSAITGRHYAGAALVEELRPVAQAIDGYTARLHRPETMSEKAIQTSDT